MKFHVIRMVDSSLEYDVVVYYTICPFAESLVWFHSAFDFCTIQLFGPSAFQELFSKLSHEGSKGVTLCCDCILGSVYPVCDGKAPTGHAYIQDLLCIDSIHFYKVAVHSLLPYV